MDSQLQWKKGNQGGSLPWISEEEFQPSPPPWAAVSPGFLCAPFNLPVWALTGHCSEPQAFDCTLSVSSARMALLHSPHLALQVATVSLPCKSFIVIGIISNLLLWWALTVAALPGMTGKRVPGIFRGGKLELSLHTCSAFPSGARQQGYLHHEPHRGQSHTLECLLLQSIRK